jgi:hypothetical protein
MAGHYERLRDLLATAPYDLMTDAEAEAALNAATVATLGKSLATPDEFVARFTPAEFMAARASVDPVVAQLMFRLSVRRDPLDLAGATVQGGLAYMAQAGLLTEARADAIGAVEPGAPITPREVLGWPEPYIWAADVIAARGM